jgi:hypothetical protein
MVHNMIENVVPQLTSKSVDDFLDAPRELRPIEPLLPNLEVTDSLSVPAAERFDDDSDQSRLSVQIPRYLLEEISWVAEAERCDVSEIVVNALDQFLADHWIRNRD